MTEAPPDAKRRRLSTANTSPQGITCVTDLPSGILAHAASFLAPPSRALFAVALDENSVITINERSSAIVGNQWNTLDFGQIERELAVKLTDSDIERVLQCIDAINNVKRLKLTNCTKITGAGLEPLRGSAVIEQIDLSLIGNESPNLDPVTSISLDHVLPILYSIIAREDCALKHLHFPSAWREDPSAVSFNSFILRYNQMFTNRGSVHCLECNRSLPIGGEWIETGEDNHYGTHMYTCYDCLKHYCHGCNYGQGIDMLHYCNICNRDYCEGCSEMTICSFCGENICNDCYKYKCVECDEEFCSKCVQNSRLNIHKCEYCDECYCQECNVDDVGIHICHRCNTCNTKCCDNCLLQRYRQEQLHCTKCINRSVAMGERFERKQLQDEVKQLKVEMEELKRQIEELKLENEELRSNVT